MESYRSREVGLHKVPLVYESALSFLIQPTRAEIFRPTELKDLDCTSVLVYIFMIKIERQD